MIEGGKKTNHDIDYIRHTTKKNVQKKKIEYRTTQSNQVKA